MRVGLMFENTEAIWVEIRQGDTEYLVSCVYRPPSATTEYYEKNHWHVWMLGWLNIPLFLWVILILITFWMRLYLLIQSTILKLYLICTSYLTNQHEWTIKPPLCWMSFLRPTQYFDVRVQFLNIHLVTTILFTLHMEFGNVKPSMADHNTVKFRDMKNFDMESFSNDLI